MVGFEEVGEMLDEITDGLPDEFFYKLNGGVSLLEGVKTHRVSESADPLYTLGEYRVQPGGLGRYIVIYYGSFAAVYGHLDAESLKEKLRETVYHEFTHHMESLAGLSGLEKQDAADLERYKKRQTH